MSVSGKALRSHASNDSGGPSVIRRAILSVAALADHIPGRPCNNCASHAYWPTVHGKVKKAHNGVSTTLHGSRRSDELLGHHGSDRLYGRGRSDVLWGDWQG